MPGTETQTDDLRTRWDAAVMQNKGLENQLTSCLEGGQNTEQAMIELLAQHERDVLLAGRKVGRIPPPGPIGWGRGY